ncbi:MAG: MerR family transcriptional regulator [Endomicrobiaceae bacterium]|nr:MerR family transcriptional regulator [Endomicrobiaceae bacterium]
MDIKKYLSISEVAERVHVKAHTLRYWEKEKLLKPERHSGLRKYSTKDIDLINEIKDLLYNKKITISGVKKILKGDKRVKDPQLKLFKDIQDISSLKAIKEDIKEILNILKQ